MTHASTASPARKRGKKKLGLPIVLVLVLGTAVGGLYAVFGRKESDAAAEWARYTVRRSPLAISLTERGTLDAGTSTAIKNEVEGQRKILRIHVQDGQVVSKGQKLAELDVADLAEKISAQRTRVYSAEAAKIAADNDLKKQEITNRDAIAKAKLDLELAEGALEKYRKGDYRKQLQTFEAQLRLAESERSRQTDWLEWSKRLNEKGYLSKNELDADEIKLDKAKVDVELAALDIEMLNEFEKVQEEKKLLGDVASKKNELEKAELTATAEIEIRGAKKKSDEQSLSEEAAKLAKYEMQTQLGVLTAPADGLVMFGIVERGRWGSNDEAIQEGANVREGQTIFMMPDTSVMMAHTNIQEAMHNLVYDRVQRRAQVLEGRPVAGSGQLPAKITVDSLGGRLYRGVVETVSSTHDKGASWINPNLKLFPTRVKITDPVDGLRPGMSCTVEILVEEIPNALQVPIQAVRNVDGENVVFVEQDGQLAQRKVKVGRDNGLYVEITEGLNDGDEILVSRAALATGKPLQSKNNDTPSAPKTEDGAPVGEPSPRGEVGVGSEARPEGAPGSGAGEGRRGGRSEGGRAGSGEGRRGGFDPAQMDARLKAVATPEDWAAYEAAKASEDREARMTIIRKYREQMTPTSPAAGGGGQ
ncbi:MAG: biotin/lipoyl-binding protein [Planctomycetes bacterium]|nr:biotin/lipoyl-binding protein [Planctomycetota bacterium]